MAAFVRPEHQAVASALRAMDHDLLLACRCWFGGGTEIVLGLGEYRLSRDIDFLCADPDGYRRLRSLMVAVGASALFGASVRTARAFRSDQYGVREIVSVDDVPIRVEIVREAHIPLEGHADHAGRRRTCLECSQHCWMRRCGRWAPSATPAARALRRSRSLALIAGRSHLPRHERDIA